MELRVEVRKRGKLLQPGTAEVEVRRAINMALAGAAEEISANVTRATPVGATAQLRGAWGVKKRPSKLEARVVNNKEYGPVVELGRRPGRKFPPPKAIRLWVKSGPLQITDPKQIPRVAYLIGRKIAERGIPATHFAEESFEKSLAVLERRELGPGLTVNIVRRLES